MRLRANVFASVKARGRVRIAVRIMDMVMVRIMDRIMIRIRVRIRGRILLGFCQNYWDTLGLYDYKEKRSIIGVSKSEER